MHEPKPLEHLPRVEGELHTAFGDELRVHGTQPDAHYPGAPVVCLVLRAVLRDGVDVCLQAEGSEHEAEEVAPDREVGPGVGDWVGGEGDGVGWGGDCEGDQS